MSDNKKQMMDIQKIKSFSVAVSDEHQRNWGDDLFSRKENDPKHNYDRSRTRLNFQVSKGGELGPVDKTKSITDKIEQAIKNRVTGRVNATSNRAVNIVFGGNREQMRKLAFGDQTISENGNNWDVDSCSGIDRWATDIYDFCCREFGEENVVSFIVHLDELNPHAHAVIVPITKDGRLSAKDLFGGYWWLLLPILQNMTLIAVNQLFINSCLVTQNQRGTKTGQNHGKIKSRTLRSKYPLWNTSVSFAKVQICPLKNEGKSLFLSFTTHFPTIVPQMWLLQTVLTSNGLVCENWVLNFVLHSVGHFQKRELAIEPKICHPYCPILGLVNV